MNVTLNPPAEAYVRQKLAAQKGRSANEIVNEAILFLRAREAGWRTQIEEGLAQARRGELLNDDEIHSHLAERKSAWLSDRRKK